MTRRSLAKSIAATVGALTIARPSLVTAVTLNRGVWATLFDGATKLQSNGPLANCPASSPYGMSSYWYSYPGSWTSTNQLILGQTIPAGPQNLEIYHLITGSTKHPSIPNIALYILFSTGSTPGSTGFVMSFTPSGTFLPSTGYHLVQISWDLTTPTVKATIDGNPLQLGMSSMPPFTGGIQLNTWGGVTTNWLAGGGIFQGGGFYKGNLAEVYTYFLSNPPPDIYDPTTKDGFLVAGKPPQFDHLSQNGIAAMEEIEAPQIYLSGPAGVFPLNGKRPVNTGTQSIVHIDDANNFSVVSGQLQTPTTDPWGNVGV